MPVRWIGVDCDGVTLRCRDRHFFLFCRHTLSWKVDWPKYLATHNWREAIPDKDSEEIQKVYFVFLDTCETLVEAIPGAVKGLAKLKEAGYQLAMVSARPERILPLTVRALQRFGVHHFFDKILHGYRLCKGKAIAEYGLDVLIEDSVPEINAMRETGVNIPIIRFPCFQGLIHPPIRGNGVHTLSACGQVHEARKPQDEARLCEAAWAEAADMVLTLGQ